MPAGEWMKWIRSRIVQPVVSRYTDWATRPTYRNICVRLIAEWSEKVKRAATLLNISVQFKTRSVTSLDKWEQFPERKRKLAWLHIRAWPAANANDSYDTGSSWSLRRDETQTKLRGKRKQGGGQLHPVTSVDRFPSLFWLLHTEPDLTVALGSNFLEMWTEYKTHSPLHISLFFFFATL